MARSEATITAMKPFYDLLLGLDKGRVLQELSDRLVQVTEAVQETAKKGTVTLKITISPRDDETVDVEAVTSMTAPKPDHSAVFFVTDDHKLSRDDPAYESPLISYDDAKGGN